jgi:hypothetical protein
MLIQFFFLLILQSSTDVVQARLINFGRVRSHYIKSAFNMIKTRGFDWTTFVVRILFDLETDYEIGQKR